MNLNRAREALLTELERIYRRDNEEVVEGLCGMFQCGQDRLTLAVDQMIFESRCNGDDVVRLKEEVRELEEQKDKLEDMLEKSSERTVDIGEVEKTLEKLKKKGPKVVHFQVTMELS